MFCSGCGKQLPDGSGFCSGCGKKLGTAGQQAVSNSSISGDQPKFHLIGFKGELKVYENRVEIKKKGSGFITGNTNKTLPMANIMSVSVTPSTIWARGFIEFTVPGGKDSANIEQALRNENALPLAAAGQNEEAMKIKTYVEEQILKQANNKSGTTIVQQATSPAEELKKMKELLDMGIITQEEFDAKKKQLLGL